MLATTLAFLLLSSQVEASNTPNVQVFGQSFPTTTTDIQLSSTGLTGVIGSQIGQLVALTSLSVASNSLTGSIPSQISRLSLLSALRLGSNQLSGPIPSELGLLSLLTLLSIETNLLSGTIPSELGRLTRAQTVKLSNNQFRGQIPVEVFGGLVAARLVSFNRNLFAGSIPARVSAMQNLVAFDISQTAISGTLPDEIFALPVLGGITASDTFVSLSFANSVRCGLLFDCLRSLISSSECSQCSLTVASQTATSSLTPSQTPSPTTTSSPSTSATPSRTASPSASLSISTSPTVTPTASSSLTISASSTPTPTASVSASLSISISPSLTASLSESASTTKSSSVSLTTSLSTTKSAIRASTEPVTFPTSAVSATSGFSAFPSQSSTPGVSVAPSASPDSGLGGDSSLKTTLIIVGVSGGSGLVAAVTFIGYHGVRRRRAKNGLRDGLTVATAGVGFITLGKAFPIIGQLISLVKDMNDLYEDMQDTGYLSHHFLLWTKSLCEVLARVEVQLERANIPAEHVTRILLVVIENVKELNEVSHSYANRGKLAKFVGTITFKRTLDRLRDSVDVAIGALQVGLDSHIIEQNYQLLQVVENLQAKHTASEMSGFFRAESLNAIDIDPGLVRFLDDQAFAAGGQASIFRAKYQGNIVAVKVFDCATMPRKKRDELTTRILDEIALLCRLRDPNLINFYGAITKNPDEIVIVMDLAECGNLRDFLQMHPNLSAADRIRFLLDLAYGLRYLHERDVEHRDLKSLNCLLKRDQNNLVRAKVADFGASRVGDRDQSSESIVSTRAMDRRSRCSARIVSCGWTPPEVLDGGKHSKASDTYAFGILIWEVMTSQLPYPEEMADVAVGIAALQGKRPTDFDQQHKVTPPELDKLMRECWASIPANRPSMTKVVAELESISRHFFETPRMIPPGSNQEPQRTLTTHSHAANPSFVHSQIDSLNTSFESGGEVEDCARVSTIGMPQDSSFEEDEESEPGEKPKRMETENVQASPTATGLERNSSEFAFDRKRSIDWKRKQSARIRSARCSNSEIPTLANLEDASESSNRGVEHQGAENEEPAKQEIPTPKAEVRSG